MTSNQIAKLDTRIATLKSQDRIVWIEGIDAPIIHGKVAGKPAHFVKADSLNVAGGSWYYIVRWNSVEWMCSCESVKPCKHEKALQININASVKLNRVKAEVTAATNVVARQYDAERRCTAPLNGNRPFSLMR